MLGQPVEIDVPFVVLPFVRYFAVEYVSADASCIFSPNRQSPNVKSNAVKNAPSRINLLLIAIFLFFLPIILIFDLFITYYL